jgi:3-hydroxyisobutyrate dehydrogenase-like beta-hydroxyacid dehydrogenase
MAKPTICVLHPGEMGSAVGRAARTAGARVLWSSTGRGEATRRRAAEAGLEDAGTLAAALGAAEIALSVCPPHAALDVARSVAAQGFRGLFVDANAVAPEKARRLAAIVEGAGARFVDGGIVGPPPSAGSSTRLYLSGEGARRVAELFEGTPLGTIVLDAPVGAASAVKMCYAAWTKGSATLLLAVRTLAETEGVDAALAEEWRISKPDLFRQLDRAVVQSRKAWRWIGEMEEIAATFAEAGLPEGFHLAAAEICRRLESFKDARGTTLEELVAALRAATAKKPVSAAS